MKTDRLPNRDQFKEEQKTLQLRKKKKGATMPEKKILCPRRAQERRENGAEKMCPPKRAGPLGEKEKA